MILLFLLSFSILPIIFFRDIFCQKSLNYKNYEVYKTVKNI